MWVRYVTCVQISNIYIKYIMRYQIKQYQFILLKYTVAAIYDILYNNAL